MFFLPPPICNTGEMKAITADKSWMHSFDHHLKQQNVEWHAQKSSMKKIAWHSQML
jgi:hypothetical protein